MIKEIRIVAFVRPSYPKIVQTQVLQIIYILFATHRLRLFFLGGGGTVII